MNIITDHKWRNLLHSYELSKRWRKEFDYIDADDFDDHAFIRYRGQVYDVSEFMRTGIEGWDGIATDTFFSGTLIKLSPDGEQAKMGRVYL